MTRSNVPAKLVPSKFRYLNMRELIGGDSSKLIKLPDADGPAIFEQTLICLGEVQKSGARIYYHPGNHNFTCNGKDYFDTYSAAYQSENW